MKVNQIKYLPLGSESSSSPAGPERSLSLILLIDYSLNIQEKKEEEKKGFRKIGFIF